MNEIIRNSNEAASLVLTQAMQAATQGTFAVGGCIIENATGKVICAMHNNVLKPLSKPLPDAQTCFTFDPTAHGERQLVYWYYENKQKLGLPNAEDLTIVTTLDPCAMCTGTLLTAGFNVAVVAIDDFAGINYDGKFAFLDLPESLRKLARSKFGYYACDSKSAPSKYVRHYVGGANVAFKDTVVDSQLLAGCNDIFSANADKVRTGSSNSGLTPDKLSNPANLPEDSQVKTQYRHIYPNAFKMNLPVSRLPNLELRDLLLKVQKSEPNAKNAVALLDSFGNVVLCLPDTFNVSPVHTAFMNVTQAYAITRFNLINNEATRAEAVKTLTHPKYGTFVFLYAPDPNDTTTIMTLGAYGSTMEGSVPQPFPANFQYFYPPLNGTFEELSSVIMKLPPFYTQFAQLSVMQTPITVNAISSHSTSSKEEGKKLEIKH